MRYIFIAGLVAGPLFAQCAAQATERSYSPSNTPSNEVTPVRPLRTSDLRMPVGLTFPPAPASQWMSGAPIEPSRRPLTVRGVVASPAPRLLPTASRMEPGDQPDRIEYFDRALASVGSSAASQRSLRRDRWNTPSAQHARTQLIYPESVIRFVDGDLQVAGYQPVQPVQPVQPIQPQPIPPSRPDLDSPQASSSMVGSLMRAAGASTADFQQLAQRQAALPGHTEGLVGPEVASNASSDLANALANSPNVQSTKVQRRSPTSLDPNIRGYKAGQVYSQANGVYWLAARRDLDTMLSKIDPGTVQNAIVIPGPYGLRYGPGFAFIDVVREPAPRYTDGTEMHFDTSGTVRTNGGQVYGRETVYGGGSDWGFRISYGQRKGSDYESGNNLPIPSSYNNRDILGEVSYDINPHQHIDFSYQRLDQTDTEYPGQFFDIGHLGTYGFELRVVDDAPAGPWDRLSVEGWYNRTSFSGNTLSKANRNFLDLERVNWGIDQHRNYTPRDLDDIRSSLNGTSDGAVSSSGVRAGITFGQPDETHTRIGVDFRYLGQVMEENFSTSAGADPLPPGSIDPLPGQLANFRTNMPHAWLVNPGLYAEWSSPMNDRWKLSLGGRVDFAGTKARADDVRANTSLPDNGRSLKQDDVLYAFYLQNEFDVGCDWTLRAGFGHGQRPPTLIERYADSLFLGILQSGFTRVIGAQTLKPERNWQIDVGLSTVRDRSRFSANLFHAWVLDYVTLEDDSVVIAPPPDPVDFADARLVRFMNTPLATLAGFEMAGELDFARWLTGVGSLSYVEGRDQSLGAPLWAISPLESTLGLRVHDCDQGRRWGITLGARIVDNQNRLGTIRRGGQTNVVEEATPGFALWHLRGYWNRTENLSLVAGIDNLLDRNYQEHLDLRLRGPSNFNNGNSGPSRVLSPGFTPYFGVNWVF